MKLSNYIDSLSKDVRIVGLEKFFKELISSKQVPLRIIAERCGTPYRSLMNYLRGTRSVPLEVSRNIIQSLSNNKREYNNLMDLLFKNAVYAKSTCSHSKSVKLPKIFDKDLAYLIGAIHDGCVFSNPKKNQYLIQYVQHSNKNWLITLSEMLHRVFELKPKQYNGYIQLSNKVVYEFFSKVLKIPQYQGDWSSFLDGKPWQLQKLMIIGMFDAEGWCGTSKDLRVKFSQKNKEKLLEIKKVLEKHNIHPGNVVVEHDNYHALYICGESLITFINAIGKLSKHPAKIAKLGSISD